MSVVQQDALGGLDIHALEPGDLVSVEYWSGPILASVIEVEPVGRYGPQLGWVTIEQLTDFEDREERLRFEAHHQYMSAP